MFFTNLQNKYVRLTNIKINNTPNEFLKIKIQTYNMISWEISGVLIVPLWINFHS